MPNPWFQFKQFTVWHDKCAMKVGTDGVLLGAWADIEQARSILDVGTGSGLIALMCAQRNQQASITAIDIEESASVQAKENFERSLWSDRLTVHHSSLEEFETSGRNVFDAIVSNPPYFHQSLQSPDRKRTLARHTSQLSPDTLLSNCARLLAPHGTIHFILPVTEGENLLAMIPYFRLFCTRKTLVYPTSNHDTPKRLLLSLKKTEEQTQFRNFAIETGVRHQYTPDFIQLAQPFYLKL